jgi:SPP1 gp7 family putative phage head morphogenesis protein
VAERYLSGRDDILREVLKMVAAGATQAQITTRIHQETSTLQAAVKKSLEQQGFLAAEIQAASSAAYLGILGVTNPKPYNVTRGFIQRSFNKVMDEANISVNNLLTGSMAKLDQDIVNITRRARLQGEPIRTISQAVEASAGALDDPNLTRKATALARSAVAQVANDVRYESFRAESEVEKVLYVGTLDHRTSDICKSLDGTVYPKDQARVPPLHVNCRSTLVPILKGESVSEVKDQLRRPAVEPKSVKELEEKGLRTRGGKVRKPSSTNRSPLKGVQKQQYMTYEQWLKTQSVAYQKAILGPKAYKAFNDSGNLSQALGVIQ